MSLEVERVSKKFGGIKALDNVSLKVSKGEIISIVGPNGSGKTTLINVISGVLMPDEGRIKLDGRDITRTSPEKRALMGISRSFQLPQLFGDLTVLENARIAISSLRPSFLKRPDEKLVEEILEMFNLWELREKRIGELSEGYRKLFDVAIAFVRKPSVLLLDEPTSSVSSSDKKWIMDIVMNAVRKMGATTIFVEHDLDVVREYSERIVVMENGRIVDVMKPGEL